MEMHPDREQLAAEPEGGDNHAAGPSRGRGRGRGRGAPGGARGASSASQGIPGSIPVGSISKLKAQLRQTKRLLARDDLTPDVRTTSERRMKTLEMELEKASQGALEVKMVTKYRGIRFFERQKLLRKIKQAKKALAGIPGDSTLEQTLLESRIDLYYVLHYPKTIKYIALFPEGTYVPHTPAPTTSNSKDAASTRASMRDAIRAKMSAGTLAAEPEIGDLGIEGEEDVGSGAAGGGAEGEKEQEKKEKRGSDEMEEVERPAKKVRVEEVPAKVEVEVFAKTVEEPEAPVTEAEKKEVSAKKAKKDAKDAKRREKKEAETKAAEEAKKPAKTAAFDDDFFE
ncbi:hypothetical protein P7C70_g142, partial [Phenoliferia sp. Uapishka_3]